MDTKKKYPGTLGDSEVLATLATNQVAPVVAAVLIQKDGTELFTTGSSTQVGGHTVVSQAEFTRPENTTAYDALDTVCNSTGSPAVLTFANVARAAAGSGYITSGRIMTSQTTCTARFRLHLFNVTPTPIADNAPYTMLYANRASRIGVLDFGACRTEGAGSTAANQQNIIDRMPFVCAAASTTLYGILETLDAFTPASAQTFFVGLGVEQN